MLRSAQEHSEVSGVMPVQPRDTMSFLTTPESSGGSSSLLTLLGVAGVVWSSRRFQELQAVPGGPHLLRELRMLLSLRRPLERSGAFGDFADVKHAQSVLKSGLSLVDYSSMLWLRTGSVMHKCIDHVRHLCLLVIVDFLVRTYV